MPARIPKSAVVLAGVVAVLAIFVVSFVYYDRIDPEAVESELMAEGIVGSTRAEAVDALNRLTIPAGSELSVGSFDPSTRTLFASISNAQRLLWQVWRVQVTVGFDSSERVESVSVNLTGDRPL